MTDPFDPICVACPRPLSQHPWTEGDDPGCMGCFTPEDIVRAGWTEDQLRAELLRRAEAAGSLTT